MEFTNLCPFPSLCYSMLDVKDQEYRVVVTRVTYQLVQEKKGTYRSILIEENAPPLCLEDQFFGAMNLSSTRYESDLAPFKPRCDVLLQATAFAPEGRPARAFPVRMRLWCTEKTSQLLLDKTLEVTGERFFKSSRGLVEDAWELTRPEPFTELQLRYELAFGGECRIECDEPAARQVDRAYWLTPEQQANHPSADHPPIAHTVWEGNPIGRGFAEPWYVNALKSRELAAPRIQTSDHPITGELLTHLLRSKHKQVDFRIPPAGFGPIGRAWLERRSLAGTYDAEWLETRHPFLPYDFDFGYWNCAPADQQIEFPPPSLRIELTNLTPGGSLVTSLPGHRAFVMCWLQGELPAPIRSNLDTLLIDAENLTLTCVWRALLRADWPLERLEARFEVDPEAPLLKLRARNQSLPSLES